MKKRVMKPRDFGDFGYEHGTFWARTFQSVTFCGFHCAVIYGDTKKAKALIAFLTKYIAWAEQERKRGR